MEGWTVEGSTATLTCYTLGDDVIAQTKSYWQFISSQWELQSTDNARYLLYDGHGSTRQLAEYNTEVTITESFSYDGYGVLLQDEDNFPPNGAQAPGKVAQQATSMLYAGEHFDTDSQNYYLRARWYDSLSGRFNRMDPFPGNNQDPQSLHKYLYCHANPINGIDLSGLFGTFTSTLVSITIMSLIPGIIAGATSGISAFAQGGGISGAFSAAWAGFASSFVGTFISLTLLHFLFPLGPIAHALAFGIGSAVAAALKLIMIHGAAVDMKELLITVVAAFLVGGLLGYFAGDSLNYVKDKIAGALQQMPSIWTTLGQFCTSSARMRQKTF